MYFALQSLIQDDFICGGKIKHCIEEKMVLLERFGLLETMKMMEIIKLDPREAPKWLKFRNWQF